MKQILKWTAVFLLAISAGGCRRDSDMNNDHMTGGGTVDHSDPDAPKQIASDDLTFFSASFYVYDDYSMRRGSWYSYSLSVEDGKLMLAEDRAYRIRTEADPSLKDDVQHIIEKHKLAKLNGIDKHTAGLPDEFQPCSLSAVYASGEKLYFSFNNEPEAQWAKDLRKLFNRVFTDAGYAETAEDENNYVIDHFSLEFMQEDSMTYRYGMISAENDLVYFYRNVYDRKAGKSLSFEFADMENGLLGQLSEKIEELDLQRLHEDSHSDPDHNQDFLEIHVDYVSSRQIYGEYEADEIPEAWNEGKDSLIAFLDAYLMENRIAESLDELEEMISEAEDEAIRKELEHQILQEEYEGWKILDFEKKWEDDGTIAVSAVLGNGTEEKEFHCHLKTRAARGVWSVTDFHPDEE